MGRRRTLPAAPLLRAIVLRGGIDRCGPDPALRRAYFRAQQRGELSFGAADELAVRLLGLHPTALWGDDWLQVDPPQRRSRA